jgi:pimeloyl-ACP methyl ester carboxylesterase
VMDAAGLESAFLFGISEGGPMCLQFAAQHPDRCLGLILLGTTAKFLQTDDYPIGLPRESLEYVSKAWGSGKMREILVPNLTREQMDDETYRAMERLTASWASMAQLVQTQIELDVRSILPDLKTPALVIHFSGDLAIPIRMGRSLAECLPNARFLEVNASDHVDLTRSPEAVAAVEQFCTEVLEGRFVPDR